ncbi:MAG: hypothetical protein ABSB23_03610 [Bryobacteraceae bacterium]|jgi:uncharacterized protein (TIGR03437 family)
MDAATAAFKKTAFVLSLALLAAMPRLAQAATPAFTSPTSSTVVTLVNGAGSISVTGSEDTGSSAQPISFSVSVAYQTGDPGWLSVGDDTNVSGGCTGGSYTYTTPIAYLGMGVGCNAGRLTSGNHTASVTFTASAPAGVSSVTFTVNYNTNGGATSALSATPANLTGANAMSASVGGEQITTVALSTTSSSPVGFTTSSGASWLTVTSNTSQVTSGSPATLTFTANAAGLSVVGSPYSTTAIVSYGSGQQLSISVTFNVGTGPVSLSPGALSWTYSSGTLSPSATFQDVTLTTPNNDSYSATVSYPSGAPATNWLLVDNSTVPVSGLTNGNTLVISLANYGNLAAGTYTGTITVTDTGNSSNSASLTVTLTVSGSSSGSLTISPSPISLSSTNSYEQSVMVTSVAGGAFSATASSANNWLGVSTSASSIVPGASGYLTVTANTSLSGSGTFSGIITVTVGTVSQQVTVNLTAGSGAAGSPSGYVAPTTLNLVAQSGTTAAVTQEIVFAGSGSFSISGSPHYSANSDSVAWFSTSGVAGNLSTQGTAVTVYASPRNLGPGTYTATVQLAIVANGVAVSPAPSLSVNFIVTAGDVLAASPSVVLLNNGTTSDTVSVTTTSSTPLSLNVTADQTWLSATLQGSTTPTTISVTANITSLTNGLYSGNVLVTSGTTPPLYVPVVVVVAGVTNPSGLTTSSPSLTFAAQVGGSAPANQTLTVSSSPSGTAFTASASVTTPTGGTWLSIAPKGSLTTNQALAVSVNQSGLATGTYTGNIALTANGATLNVPVNLVVNTTGTTGGNITVSASALGFSALAAGTAPASQTLTVSSTAGSSGVAFTAAASSSGNWLSVSPTSGTTQALLTVAVNQASLSAGSYTGTITITPTGGTAVVVTVSLSVVSEPTISVSPGLLSFDFQVGSGGTVSPGILTVTAAGGTASFQASASSSPNWLTVTPASGSTSTSTTLSVQVNPAGLAANTTPYTGTITVSGVSGTQGSVTVDVSLSVTNPLPIVAAVLNAASFVNGPISPGEIVSIFGSSIGPVNPASLTLNSAGKVATSIGGVQVSFSGYLAPLTYASSTQINAIVPYEITASKAPFVEVIFAGQKSNEPGLQLTTSAPGIFTQNGSGTGPGAILNPDNSLNTQANAAPKGGEIQIFMTGEGLTTPAQADGTVTPANLSGVGPITPAPQLVVSVLIGGVPAKLEFAGEAPGLVAGLLQVNADIPATATSGANSITVQIGKNISQNNVTVWVQ